MTKNKEQKDFYNFIRQVYKKKPDIGEIPDFMKVYYEIERVHNFEVNKFYYAVCNKILHSLKLHFNYQKNLFDPNQKKTFIGERKWKDK